MPATIATPPAPSKTDEPAAAMVFSVYPHERKALQRMQDQFKFKTPFDVVRKLALESHLTMPGEFNFPKPRK